MIARPDPLIKPISTYTQALPHLFSCKNSIISVVNKDSCFEYLPGVSHRLLLVPLDYSLRLTIEISDGF